VDRHQPSPSERANPRAPRANPGPARKPNWSERANPRAPGHNPGRVEKKKRNKTERMKPEDRKPGAQPKRIHKDLPEERKKRPIAPMPPAR